MAIAPPAEETEVVRRARDGDGAAFQHLYETYLPKIYDYVLGMLRNRADAEDVTSETFLRAVERLTDLRDPTAFKSWLYAIARNAALRVVDGRRRAVPVDEHNEAQVTLDPVGLPVAEDHAEGAELAALLDEAASTLGERERTVYELSVRHGLSSAEIGRVLGVRPAYAYILVNRLKASVSEAVEAVVLARVGRAECAELAELLEGSGEVSSRVRKAVARHARSCDLCAETKRHRASLPALLQGVAFAEPAAHFASDLSRRIDAQWGLRTSAAASAAVGAIAGAIVTVVVLAGVITGMAAQRTIMPQERVTRVQDAVVNRPASAPQPGSQTTVSGPNDVPTAVPLPAPDQQVAVVTGGDDAQAERGSSSSNNSTSSSNSSTSSSNDSTSTGGGQPSSAPPRDTGQKPNNPSPPGK